MWLNLITPFRIKMLRCSIYAKRHSNHVVSKHDHTAQFLIVLIFPCNQGDIGTISQREWLKYKRASHYISSRLNLDYPTYRSLKEPARFNLAHIKNGTVAWTDDTDLSLDTLYLPGDVLGANSP